MKKILLKNVYVRYRTWNTILLHSVQYCNERLPRSNWVEVIGLLAGQKRGTQIILEQAFPISHGTLTNTSVTDNALSVFELIDPLLEKHGWWIIGWYHSHPGHGLFLSSTDQETHQRFHNHNSDAIAIVIDPSHGESLHQVIDAYQIDLHQQKGYRRVPVTFQRPQIGQLFGAQSESLIVQEYDRVVS